MQKQPNIIFIMADDLGCADLSCCGQTDFSTPVLDGMAAEGVRFTQAYANAPLCTNTRVAMMTGRYQYRYKIGLTEPLRHASKGDPTMGLPAAQPTLPSRLRAAGYRTSLVGKWHVGALPHFGPLKSGYDAFYGIMGGYTGYFTKIGDGNQYDFYEDETTIEDQGYVTDLITARAVKTIDEAAQSGQAFFLSLHYNAPHWPWSAPAGEAAARIREADPKQVHDGGSLKIYGEMVKAMDAGIGQVREALRRNGLTQNTLILFTSDNGGERFSKIWPFVGRKRDLLEGGLRVPQIVLWPGQMAGGRVSDQVTSTMDLSVTCLAAAGVDVSGASRLDGISLLPLPCEGASVQPRTLFWRMKERDQRAVRHNQWKYLKVKEQEFLFDLDYDARERTDFSTRQPEVLADLKQRWETWNRDMLPMPSEPSPIMVNLSDMLW